MLAEQDLLYFFRIVKEQPITLVPRNQKQTTRCVACFCPLTPTTHARGAPLFGGAGRDRTDDPLLAKQVLSQLSYSPVWQQSMDGGSGWIRTIDPRLIKTVLKPTELQARV